jgi:DNA invertase Pin-like site-specific DNA recombinase
VLGIEMSRLARSGRDWYQLMELGALSGALLGDAEGVYDPTEDNDRLLLGLKGTLAEAELHLIRQRMQAGRGEQGPSRTAGPPTADRLHPPPVRGSGARP